MPTISAPQKWAARAREMASASWRGVLVCGVAAVAAKFLSEHYGAPAMLMALLLGLALSFLGEKGNPCEQGVGLSARGLLRLGVALLGARISFDLFAELGAAAVGLIVLAIAATIGFGWAAAALLGRGWRLAVLTAGSVAICGASAAMALAAILPKNEFSERNLSFTVFGVTILSTIAMVAYPILAQSLGLDERQTGLFLGGTIHDVAQVVGAGFTISESIGETSTSVKLMRVSMLAPVVLIIALALRRKGFSDAGEGGARPPLLPSFVVAFFALAFANSMQLIPADLQAMIWEASKWLLLTAIAAVGVKTDLRRFVEIPPQSIVLIVAETLFIAAFVLIGVVLWW